MRKSCQGFTLLEILMVVAIVSLLSALMFPVAALAKRAAKRSSCTQQLRQIGLAVAMYENDNGGYPPSLEALKDADILRSTAIVLCPDDPIGGYASKFDECRHVIRPFPQSYETMFHWYPYQIAQLRAADENHGIVVCRLHGDKTQRYAKSLAMFCTYAWFMFEGPLLRLRRDGSLQTAKLRIRRKQKGPGLYEESVSRWQLFTDAPDPISEKINP